MPNTEQGNIALVFEPQINEPEDAIHFRNVMIQLGNLLGSHWDQLRSDMNRGSADNQKASDYLLSVSLNVKLQPMGKEMGHQSSIAWSNRKSYKTDKSISGPQQELPL